MKRNVLREVSNEHVISSKMVTIYVTISSYIVVAQFSQSIINFNICRAAPYSQNAGNNFDVLQSTLLNKLIRLGLLSFENAGQAVRME